MISKANLVPIHEVTEFRRETYFSQAVNQRKQLVDSVKCH